ncbi:MAG: HAD family hydrolase [Pseudomonadales bacterium]|nr:MAG: HAD family hydrolase [Pseudomonadales bacterium]
MDIKSLVAHATETDAVFAAFVTSEEGLNDSEALSRKQRFGANQLPLAPPKPAWRRFMAQFDNVLIYVLIGSAVASLLLAHYVDAAVIFAVVIINAIVGFVQEGKAEDALRAIMSMTRTQCMVVRGGALESVDSADLVPGDVVMLQAGDRVPADLRLFYSKDLRCDESALTGEAQPVGKHSAKLSQDTILAERKNMAYMGTMVTYGVARGVVVSTALHTELGEISALVKQIELEQTPLQQQLSRFARQLTAGIIVFAALTLLMGVTLHGYSVSEMFQAAIGIAVSSIPEGLPAIVTVALAIGVRRMAKNNALVRRLPAVEVLGAVDVVCSDKTGTLTANKMTVREAFTASGNYKISGEGYRPEGGVTMADSGQIVAPGADSVFTAACEIALLCNDANLESVDGSWTLHGDPTEGALLVMAMKHGIATPQLRDEWPRVDLLPFDSDRRYMATLHHNTGGQLQLLVKGAPERLFNFASEQLSSSGVEPLRRSDWEVAVASLAARGMRVMALAQKNISTLPDPFSCDDAESGLVMVGLAGISDPPRAEAIASIKMCHDAGIRVKMITGDNPVTAAAIGAELGLETRKVLTGSDIDCLAGPELVLAIEGVDIFARTSPANKLQLVAALQENRHVVAMTGDGVNDAPALKTANIGVAMGMKGSEAAKEAADFILTDDNFSTIAHAVREGRNVYDNIVKSIIFILPTNLAEALVIFAAIVFGRMMPITPAQILWVNMITAVTLALALAFERAEDNIMQRPPRPFGRGLFTGVLVFRTFLVGVLAAVIVFSLFFYLRAGGASIELARSVAINTLVMIEVFYLFNCRFLNQSIFSMDFLQGMKPMAYATASVVLIQLVFTYSPVMQGVFGIAAVEPVHWLYIIGFALPILFIVELEKALQRLWLRSRSRLRSHLLQ